MSASNARDAVFVLSVILVIKNSPYLEIGGSSNYAGVTVVLIACVAGVSSGLTSLDNEDRAAGVPLRAVATSLGPSERARSTAGEAAHATNTSNPRQRGPRLYTLTPDTLSAR